MLKVAGNMNFSVLADDAACAVDENSAVVLHQRALLLSQLGITEVKAHAQLPGEFKQRQRFSTGHAALEIAVQLVPVFEIPARKKGGQRQFGIDDDMGAQAMCLTHHGAQALHHACAGICFLHRPKLAQCDVDDTAHGNFTFCIR